MKTETLFLGSALFAIACSVGDVHVDRGQPDGGAEPLHFYSVPAFLSAVRKTACANVEPCCKGQSADAKDCTDSLEVFFGLSSDATSPFSEDAALECYRALQGAVGNCFADPHLTPCFEITPKPARAAGRDCSVSCHSDPGGGSICAYEDISRPCNREDGVFCDFSGHDPSLGGTCTPLRKEGGACEDQWACDDGLRCSGGKCIPLLPLGASCNEVAACNRGYCDFSSGSGTGICAPDLANGALCSTDGAESCASANCEDLTRCAPRMSKLARIWMCADFAPVVEDGGSLCGDGVVDSASEACDGSDLSGKTCASASMGLVSNGTLSCRHDCQFDLTKCVN